MTEAHEQAPADPDLLRPRAPVMTGLNRSVFINGIGVSGREPAKAAGCRLDLPGEELLAALHNAQSA
ncbi:MAG: hypothetical protein ACRDOH_20795 [Streptosporangiaceae bacterium]